MAEADPCSCWPALLVALDGEVLLEGPEGARAMKVRDLLADAYTPNLADAELITRIALRRASLAGHRGIRRFQAHRAVLSNGQLRLAGDV